MFGFSATVHLAVGRGGVHDFADYSCQHGDLRAKIGRKEGIEGLLVACHAHELVSLTNTSIAEDDVKLTVLCVTDGFLKNLAHLIRAGEVRNHLCNPGHRENRAASCALALDTSHHIVQLVVRPPVEIHVLGSTRPWCRQEPGELVADAARGARDKDGLAAEVIQHRRLAPAGTDIGVARVQERRRERRQRQDPDHVDQASGALPPTRLREAELD
mmetsp:Transcript_107961/g.306021  ORF Transcript_107961/g.306021 Transcript_107961/m.306021 type:complete len:215 (+) Transcript_107961:642-1286(+)